MKMPSPQEAIEILITKGDPNLAIHIVLGSMGSTEHYKNILLTISELSYRDNLLSTIKNIEPETSEYKEVIDYLKNEGFVL